MIVLIPTARELFEVARGLGQQVLQFDLQEIRADQRRHEKTRHQHRLVFDARAAIVAADAPALARKTEVALPGQGERDDVAVVEQTQFLDLVFVLAEQQDACAEADAHLLRPLVNRLDHLGVGHDVGEARPVAWLDHKGPRLVHGRLQHGVEAHEVMTALVRDLQVAHLLGCGDAASEKEASRNEYAPSRHGAQPDGLRWSTAIAAPLNSRGAQRPSSKATRPCPPSPLRLSLPRSRAIANSFGWTRITRVTASPSTRVTFCVRL